MPRRPSASPGQRLCSRNVPAGSIASALTEKLERKLDCGEQQAFHRLCYEVAKAAIERHDTQLDRVAETVRGKAETARD